MIACEQQLARTLFKSHRPVEWLDLVTPPSVGMKVVDEIAASYDEDTFIAQAREWRRDFVVKLSRLRLIDA
jgi:hypothetical protein